jgi:nucleotide-binding universal stress UspA family protein
MPRPLKNIIAATDLSRPALEAARRAALVAREHGAAVELLYVMAHPFASDAWNQVRLALDLDDLQLRQTARRLLEEHAQRVAGETPVPIATHLAEGRPFAEIAARCAAIDAQLLVLGAHGENFLLDPLLGTTAHRVLRLAGVPTLLVRQPATSRYERAVVATDFSPDSAEAARCARRLFPDVDLTLFNAYEVPFEGKLLYAGVARETIDQYRGLAESEARKQLREFAEDAGLRGTAQVVRHGPAALRVREFASEIQADLIVTGAQGKGAMETALLGSVTLRLVNEAACDVLLARNAAQGGG